MTTETQAIDQAKAEAFAGQMVGILNGSILALMTSIGHRTGLFDKMAQLPPSTSQQIADATGLNERYIREWLGALVTGRIVEYDPANKTYRLPPEHAASITRAAGPNNLAAFPQFTALMGNVEDQVVDCFRNGGGVPYSAYPAFQKLMARRERAGPGRNAGRRDPPAGARSRREAEVRHRGRRHRLRAGARHQLDGEGFPQQPLHRLRLLRGGYRGRPARGGRVGAQTPSSR